MTGIWKDKVNKGALIHLICGCVSVQFDISSLFLCISAPRSSTISTPYSLSDRFALMHTQTHRRAHEKNKSEHNPMML